MGRMPLRRWMRYYDGDVNCEGGERKVCMSWGEAFTDDNELAASCQTEGKPICYGGFILDPGRTQNYDCKELGNGCNFAQGQDPWGRDWCFPKPYCSMCENGC